MSTMNSMGNGIMMMGDGPNLTGTWYNVNTGDHFTVRDTYFEDNKIKVQTTDGRIIGYEQLQNYVQSEVPITKNNIPVPIGDGTMSNKNAQTSSPESSILTDNNLLVGLEKASGIAQNAPQTSKSENFQIIDKAMSKVTSEPDFKIEIEWPNFPKKELSLLLDVMDIPTDEVIRYCYDKFITDKISEKISESFENCIKSKLKL